MVDIALVVIFVIWAIASLLRQIFPKLEEYDALDLLPNCRFFAPRPISKDLRIFIQASNELGEFTTNWLPLVEYKRYWWNLLWNPELKVIKTIFDLSVCFINNKPTSIYSLYYLIVLNYSNSLLQNTLEHKSVRFMVISYPGFQDQTFSLVYESNAHQIERDI